MPPSLVTFRLAITVALCLCGAGPLQAAPPLMVIGVDGAEPDLVDELLDEGKLPHLARLAERGVYARLRSELPLQSPRVWNTIATGKSPRKHGIVSFAFEEKGKTRLYNSDHRKVPTIWNILSHAGISVGVVNWWTTYPPPVVEGVVVSDHYFPEKVRAFRSAISAVDERLGPLVSPVDFDPLDPGASATGREVRRLADSFDFDRSMPSWIGLDDLKPLLQTDHDVTRVALNVQRTAAPDAMFVFLPGIDRISHVLWGCREPTESYPKKYRLASAARAIGVDMLDEYYQIVDGLVGRLVGGTTESTNILVVSDHGFEGGTALLPMTGQHETEDAIEGIFFAAGPQITSGDQPEDLSIYDLMPAMLALAGRPTAADLRGRKPGFVATTARARVPTYDSTPVERIRTESPGQEEHIIERLRAIGYLADDPSPPDATERSR